VLTLSGLPMRQIPLDLGPVSMPGLDEFIAEGTALQALDWLHKWPASNQAKVPAAYFWGPSGSGKTHLLRAMVPHGLAAGHHVMWVSALGCRMWDADLPEAPTLALIDDCERLDVHLQHLAFNLFIESASASEVAGPLSIMAAGSVPPVDLPVRDDLRTRLGWGLIFALSPLSETGVRKALHQEASRRGIALDEGVVSYLLVRYSRDLNFLMGLLDRLDRFALAEHRTVTVPLLKQMLALETE
jgi:DnaA-homolog protein